MRPNSTSTPPKYKAGDPRTASQVLIRIKTDGPIGHFVHDIISHVDGEIVLDQSAQELVMKAISAAMIAPEETRDGFLPGIISYILSRRV